jgi:hypothetical protein
MPMISRPSSAVLTALLVLAAGVLSAGCSSVGFNPNVDVEQMPGPAGDAPDAFTAYGYLKMRGTPTQGPMMQVHEQTVDMQARAAAVRQTSGVRYVVTVAALDDDAGKATITTSIGTFSGSVAGVSIETRDAITLDPQSVMLVARAKVPTADNLTPEAEQALRVGTLYRCRVKMPATGAAPPELAPQLALEEVLRRRYDGKPGEHRGFVLVLRNAPMLAPDSPGAEPGPQRRYLQGVRLKPLVPGRLDLAIDLVVVEDLEPLYLNDAELEPLAPPHNKPVD